jgi:hypothetical protein
MEARRQCADGAADGERQEGALTETTSVIAFSDAPPEAGCAKSSYTERS